jgi:hypothetical protein
MKPKYLKLREVKHRFGVSIHIEDVCEKKIKEKGVYYVKLERVK